MDFKILPLLMLLSPLCVLGQSNQGNYYYYQGKKVPLQLNTQFAFMALEAQAKGELKQQFPIKDLIISKFENDNSRNTLLQHKKGATQKLAKGSWAEAKIVGNISEANYLLKLEKLRKLQGVKYTAPYFIGKNGSRIGLSNYLFVKLKNLQDQPQLETLAAKYQLEIVGQNKFMPHWFTLSCTQKSTHNALETANIFYETGIFASAEPDLMADALATNVSNTNNVNASNDTYYNDQWGLENNGQNGTPFVDIKAPQAWEISKGDASIIVAVLDKGFELDHPDLQANTHGNGYDTASGAGARVLGAHGTSCAGIIGAAQNDEGISGVAPEASLMSISNQLDLYVNAKQHLADGINWAWQNGASVISNSWNHANLQSELIDDAIKNALENGRNGLGTIVVFSAGNDDAEVAYPANSHPDILAVGAISPCGERKNTTSCDGENWGSNFGTTLDIVAPGVQIPTTDRQGNAGYNVTGAGNYTNKNYTSAFSGTSAACPHVAGVAALVLSVNPALTVQEVNEIIALSAKKERTDLYNYSIDATHENGTWNAEMGYGLVDAHAALVMAQSEMPINQTIQLTQGWNLISTYVNSSTTIKELLAPISDQVNVLIDVNGNFCLPLQNVYNIETLEPSKGYMINVTADLHFDITGTLVDVHRPINLPSAWSYLPIHSTVSTAVTELLDSVEDQMVLLKSLDGEIYWPALGINQIGDIEPDKSYLIKMKEADNLYFPIENLQPLENSDEVPEDMISQRAVQHTTKIKTQKTATVGFSVKLANSLDMQIGNEILAFNSQGALVGSSRFDGQYLGLNIWGNDQFVAKNEGMQTGEVIQLALWCRQENTITNLVDITWRLGDGTFTDGSIFLVESAKLEEKPMNEEEVIPIWEEMTVSPNPMHTQTTIQFSLDKDAAVRIELFNLLGEQIEVLTNRSFELGTHRLVWEARQQLSGVYFCVLTVEGKKQVQKVVLQR